MPGVSPLVDGDRRLQPTNLLWRMSRQRTLWEVGMIRPNLNPDDVAELACLNQEPERSEMPLQRYIDTGRMWAAEDFDAAKKYLEETITIWRKMRNSSE